MSIRSRHGVRTIGTAAVVVSLLTALAGCSGSADAMPAPTPTPTVTPVVPYGDGTLTVATLLPRDDLARSTAEIAGVEAVARDAQAAVLAGATGIPAFRTLHRPLGVAGDGSIAASVSELASRGADVLLVRADTTSLSEIVRAASESRIAVLPLDAPAASASNLPAAVYASLSANAIDLLRAGAESGGSASTIAVIDDLGDAAAETITAEEDGGLVRIAADAIPSRREISALADAGEGVTIVGRAASPAIVKTVEALTAAGTDPSAISILSDVPVVPPADLAAALDGTRGFVAAPTSTEAEIGRVRADDPAVLDGTAGVTAYRVAALALLAAVAAGDDGGETIIQALPRVLGGDSGCSAIAPCVDGLSRGIPVAFLSVAGLVVEYTADGVTVSGPLPR